MSKTTETPDFFALGRAAHAAGKHRAPGLCPEIHVALEGRKVGDPFNNRIMTEYSRGYESAVDEECARILAS